MKSGHVKSRIFKFIIMGAAGVGKSHVLAMIVGEDPPGLRCSTPCLKRPVRVLRVGKKKGKDWKRMGGKEMSEMVAVAARHRLPDHDHKDDGMAAPPTPHHGSQQERKASSTTPLKNPQLVIDRSSLPVEHPSPEASPTLPSISAEDELLRRIEIKRDSDEVSEVDLICVVDSGGQPNFLEVLAAYLKNTTATLLVVKLSEDLSVCPVVEYYDEHGDLVGVPYRSAFTNAQTVRGCMRALQSQAMKSSEGTCPKVVFVGTHKDLEGTCDETREEKNAQLRDMVLPAVQDSVIYYGEEMKEVIFPVNAKAPGPEEKEIAANLRELLLEKSSVKPIDIPLQWYGLDFALQKLMEIQNRGVLSKTECLVEARRFHFDEASLEVALKFLSGLGTLHYYDAVLPEVVFVDPQVSLDKLTELVEYSYKLSEDPTACKLVCGDLRKFRDQGIVTLDILRGFPNHYIEGLFTACELLKLFKAQLYIAEVRPDQYFMPSLLRVAAGESKRTATINPILFYFPHGGPALGIFCGLVSFLLSIAKWRLLMELDTPTLVTRNRIAFEIPGGCPGTLTLGDSLSTHFEVSIYIPSEKCFNLCRKACPRIRQDIFTGIRKAASTLGYSNCIPREGFFCPVQSKACSHSPHPATVEGNCSLLKCTLNPGEVCSDLQGEHSVWFQPMDESCGKWLNFFVIQKV